MKSIFGEDAIVTENGSIKWDIALNIAVSAIELIGDIKSKLSKSWDDLKTLWGDKSLDISAKIDDIKAKVSEKWKDAEKWIKDKVLESKFGISTKISSIWSSITKSWGTKSLSAKLGISTKVSALWSSVKNGWNKIKRKLTFPIKVPHFSWGSKTVKIPILGNKTVPDLKINWYANGGFPDMGQLFIAREAGAEMVGNIGGKTAVANNDQITTAIAAAVGPAVYDAIMAALANEDLGNGDIAVYVGGQKITDYVIKDVKNRTIASGGINPLLV